MDCINILNEKHVLINEFNWFIKNNVKISILKLHHLIKNGCKLLENSDYDKLTRPPKFVLSGNLNAKCVINLEMNLITNAEISFKAIRPQPSVVTLRVNSSNSILLDQVVDCQNYLVNILTMLDMHAQESNFLSTNEAKHFLDQIINTIILARKSLTMPNQKSINSIIKHQNYACFNPAPPVDNVLHFYINGVKLCLAIYQLSIPQHKTQRTVIESQILLECFVPKYSEALLILSQCLSICSDLRDKLKLFNSVENRKILTQF